MMNQELFWTYGFNILINSTLSFLTVAFFVMLGLHVLRIREPRLRSFFMCIPFCKLILDLFLYDFSNWALNDHYNPLEAEPGSRMISLMLCFPGGIQGLIPLTAGIQLLVYDGRTFTLADVLSFCIHPVWIKSIVLTCATLSISFLIIWLFRLYKSFKKLNIILQSSEVCMRPIFNPALNFTLQKRRIHLCVSSDVNVPCALGIFKKYILFPADLLHELTQGEFEAIVAHELDHLHWQDCSIRLISRMLTILFWWIPTGWWLNRLEQSQEYACDHKIKQFNLSKIDLASSILKSVQLTKKTSPCLPLSIPCFINQKPLTNRIQLILEEEGPPKKFILKWLKNCLVGVLMGAILFGKFWIF